MDAGETQGKTPFTIDADFNLGEAAAPWCRAHGADVVIRRGAVPLSLPRPESRGIAWQRASGRTLILTPCGLRFLVEGGSSIRYALDGDASLADARLFLLGTALSVLAWQRGLLPLNLSAVADGGDVHAFMGQPATGKSELAAALAARGYPFFTDSLLILDPKDLSTNTHCFRCDDLKLWSCSRALANCEIQGPVRETSKYQKLYAEPHQRAAGVSGRLRTIFFLVDFQKGDTLGGRRSVRLERLSGAKKIAEVAGNGVHSLQIMADVVGRPLLFQWIAAMARCLEVLRLTCPPDGGEMLEARVERIVAALSGAESGAGTAP